MERRISIGAVILLLAFCRGVGGAMNAIETKASEQWTLPREGARDLLARTPNGAIRVGSVEGGSIRVTAVKRVRARSEAAGRAFLERMRIERRQEAGRWVVAASWPTPLPSEIQSPEVAFEIDAPRGMGLEAESGNGAITAAGTAESRLRTASGEIRASDVAGRLEAHSGNGAIQVDLCAGPVDVDTSSGGIAIRRAPSPARATSGNGAIEATDVGEASLHTSSGEIRAQKIAGRLEARSGNGAIHVELCEGPVDVNSASGGIVIRQAEQSATARTGNGEIRIEGCRGPVQADSRSGRITIRQAPSPVTATSGNGAIEATDVGEASLRTDSGGILARQVAGRLDARSGNGAIEASGAREARLHTSSGDIRASAIGGRLDAHTGNGSVRIEGCPGPVEADSSSGGITVRHAHRAVKATTGNGAIEVELARGNGPVQVELRGVGGIDLRLPENASARLEADTDSGRFDLALPPGVGVQRNRTHAEAVLGDGQGSIRLRASNGAVRVRLGGGP